MALLLAALGALVLFDAVPDPDRLHAAGPGGPRGGARRPRRWLLLLIAVLLARDVLRGGRGEPEGGEDVDLSHGSDWRTVLLLSAAFWPTSCSSTGSGWPISGAVLFCGCRLRPGQPSLLRDPLIAAALSVGTWYLFFSRGLGIELPAGIAGGDPVMDALTDLLNGFATALTPVNLAVRRASA